MISPDLQLEVLEHLFTTVIEKNIVFKDDPLLINFVSHRLEPRIYIPDQNIIYQGQESDGLFFISDGTAEVRVEDQFLTSTHVRNLNPGDHFGEVGIVQKCKRTATVLAKTYSNLAFMGV